MGAPIPTEIEFSNEFLIIYMYKCSVRLMKNSQNVLGQRAPGVGGAIGTCRDSPDSPDSVVLDTLHIYPLSMLLSTLSI